MTEDRPAHPRVAARVAVGVEDTPPASLRDPADLVGLIGSVLGIVLVCLAVIYAHNTTEGMAADVRAFAGLLQRILFVPVAVLDMAVMLVPPVAVGIDLFVRRHPVTALHGLIGGLGAVIVNIGFVLLLKAIAAPALSLGLSIGQQGVVIITIPAYVSAITGMLTAVASPARRRPVTWSWNLMWVAVAVSVVTTTTSLPGMGVALLIGRACGLAARYALGVTSQRAYGNDLVEGVRRAGFDPLTLRRVTATSTPATPDSPAGTREPQYFADHRLYVMSTTSGRSYDVIVLDGDRQVMGILTRAWMYLRSRGVEGRNTVSLRQTAERAALLTYTARSAGVTTPAVLAIAEADASMLIVREAMPPSVAFADLPDDAVTDDLVDRMWRELLTAHRCGLAHRGLTPMTYRVTDPTGAARPLLLGWESGDVASSDLARRLDLTQMIGLIATRTDATRALASATRALGAAELANLGPLLQLAALPKATRHLMTNPKTTLGELRTELAQDVPDARLEPAQITRVSARTVAMVLIVAIVIIAVLTSFNLTEIVLAVRQADWRWAVAAFGIGLVGFGGAALTFIAYSPVKLSFWRQILCQMAASFVAVAAPAGLGSAAINLRVLQRKNVPTPLAVATAALVQVTTIGMTIIALVTVTAITGSNQLAGVQVTPAMLIVIGALAAVLVTLFSVRVTRTWLLARITPMLRQTWPRLVELFSSPVRLGLGLVGQVVAITSYVTAMSWALLAFGRHVPFLSAAVVYLLGNSAGAVIPTPGGMGAIEVTESGALVAIGVNAGVAASIVILFRVVTYWIRIPLGWLAYRYARKLGEL